MIASSNRFSTDLSRGPDEDRRITASVRLLRAVRPITFLVVALALVGFPNSGQSQTAFDFLQVFEEVVKQVERQNDREIRRKTPNPQTKRLQAGLSRLGYYDGPIDGLYGPNTDRAVRGFLEDYDLAPPPGETRKIKWLIDRVEAEAENSLPDQRAVAESSPADQEATVEVETLPAGQTPKEEESEPPRAPPSNWVADYAGAHGGCAYYDHVLHGAKGPDGNWRSPVATDYFGKELIDWTDEDFKVLEEGYVGNCLNRGDDYTRISVAQFVETKIPFLKSKRDRLKTEGAERIREEAARKAKESRGSSFLTLLDREFPILEKTIAQCEQNFTANCEKVAEEALKSLDNWSKLAKELTNRTDLSQKLYLMETRALELRAKARDHGSREVRYAKLLAECGGEIGGRPITDPLFDAPIIWIEPGFTLRHYGCIFRGTEVLRDLTQYPDGIVSFYLGDFRLEFEPIKVSTNLLSYGPKTPLDQGGILALVRVQRGFQLERINNAELGVRMLLAFVQNFARFD